jgi:hypothetical protein
MFKKINIKTLVIVFALLLGILVVTELMESKKGERSFKDYILSFDKDKVTSVAISNPKGGQNVYIEKKKEGDWTVAKGEEEYNADGDRVDQLLQSLQELKPRRVAATRKDKWEDFEVTDSAAVQVRIEKDGKSAGELYIGKFSYKQPSNPYQRQGDMISYVRVGGEKEVYAVSGFLKMNFSAEVDSYRDKTVIDSEKSNWNSLDFSFPGDSSYQLVRQEGKWLAGGLLADSATVAKYLNKLSSLTSSNFAEKSQMASNTPSYTLTITGNNIPAPVQVEAYPFAGEEGSFVITSSQNKGTYFDGAKSDLFNKIFKGRSHFYKN